ncbi:MAG: Hsp20/alpha crystallin family protein, partial [Actinomycetota bacterium]|nr:Hsp20/alpha crystallin family protein [Actinomycetota bacterium]
MGPEEVWAMALLRSDPFRDVDRLFQQLAAQPAPRSSMSMPIDAYRKGDQFLIQMELPGVDPEHVDITVEDNVLTVKAERPAPSTSEDVESLVTER